MTWQDWVLEHESALRLGAFLGVFALMAWWEWRAPRRPLRLSRRQRWTANLGLVALNTLLVRLLFPLAGAGMALLAGQQGWGLFNRVEVSPALAVVLSVVALDFVIWVQHVLFHAVPLLWRLHRVHHADLDYDLTTGARFHPIEILLSMGVKFVAIVLLGPPVVAVVLFEVILNASAMFNHGNVGLPPRLDRLLRLLLVTPDMHRVHHSVEPDETNSNFGFCLSLWDRLFGTWREAPRAGHEGMVIGLAGLRDPRRVDRLPGMLALPFVEPVRGYALGRRDTGTTGSGDAP